MYDTKINFDTIGVNLYGRKLNRTMAISALWDKMGFQVTTSSHCYCLFGHFVFLTQFMGDQTGMVHTQLRSLSRPFCQKTNLVLM